MGFTPLDGLVMATRSGSVDPGLLLWLLAETGMAERERAEALEHQSGLQALAGTADMRAVLAGVGNGDPMQRWRWTSTTCTACAPVSLRWRRPWAAY
jgi:acetate kinase